MNIYPRDKSDSKRRGDPHRFRFIGHLYELKQWANFKSQRHKRDAQSLPYGLAVEKEKLKDLNENSILRNNKLITANSITMSGTIK